MHLIDNYLYLLNYCMRILNILINEIHCTCITLHSQFNVSTITLDITDKLNQGEGSVSSVVGGGSSSTNNDTGEI